MVPLLSVCGIVRLPPILHGIRVRVLTGSPILCFPCAQDCSGAKMVTTVSNGAGK